MPITEERARSTISNFCDEFPGLSQLKIIYAPTQEDFYGSKASVEALGYQIKGAFLPKRGELHLPLANFRDSGDLRKSLQHEALGHFGTLTFTSSEKRDLLEVITSSRQSASMNGDWAKVDKAYAGQSELMKAEEVFCLAAERIDGPPRNTNDQAALTWSDVVQNKTRLLEREDLQTIVESVADGIRRGTREQQIFPLDDHSQFRLVTSTAEKRAHAFLNLPRTDALTKFPELHATFESVAKAENSAKAAFLGNPAGVGQVMDSFRLKVAEQLRSGKLAQEIRHDRDR